MLAFRPTSALPAALLAGLLAGAAADGGNPAVMIDYPDDDFYAPRITRGKLVHGLVASALCWLAFPLGTAMVRGALPAHKFVNALNTLALFILSVATRSSFSSGTSAHATLGRWITALVIMQALYAMGRQTGLREFLPAAPHRVLGAMLVVVLFPVQWVMGLNRATEMCLQNEGACTARTLTWLLFFLLSLVWLFGVARRATLVIESAFMLGGGVFTVIGLLSVAHASPSGEELHMANDWAPSYWLGIGNALAWAGCGALALVQLQIMPAYGETGVAMATGLVVHALIVWQGPFYNDVAQQVTQAHALVCVVAAGLRCAGRMHAAGNVLLLAAALWLTGSHGWAWYAQHVLGLPAGAFIGMVGAATASLMGVLLMVRSVAGADDEDGAWFRASASASPSAPGGGGGPKYAVVSATDDLEDDDEPEFGGEGPGDERL